MLGLSKESTLHLGYNNVSFPQSQVAISKLSLYPESFTEGTGVIDSMRSNRNKEDIVVSRIVITGVDCMLYAQLQLETSLSRFDS